MSARSTHTSSRASSTDAPAPPPRVTRRRSETRQRMLDAAFEVFAARGFGRATVEEVCEAAGYTRGAFYSNFSSMDELFFALYEQRTAAMVALIEQTLAGTISAAQEGDLAGAVDRILASLGADSRWYAVNAEFTAHALRHPEVAAALARYRRAVRQALIPIVEAAAAGGKLPAASATPDLLARTIVAIHDGTLPQVLIEPDDESLRKWQRDLLLGATLGGRST
ncbi:TetR/AcrR family transcriptional regulator [Planosporangium flavigriseum]|uniref:TetR family transcriptional regulator n=1 Tax=Planosporangium flavigriseum TaxID=373681 RepID=A0A8J3M2D8_9ACTN|nr:TetR/AcrR family transcriptional regulator [Planosporangium flavigriseum]NJC67364.1 TetR/AcrR family transcriptional regulator [Planosporangium flavigriseum]GIG75450.1 TetR family transcriptional regulator [Planosporangium flavigriseum]